MFKATPLRGPPAKNHKRQKDLYQNRKQRSLLKTRKNHTDSQRILPGRKNPSSIRVVKKEIRILGLDICNRHRIVGAVLRGGAILDGVIKFPEEDEPNSAKLAEWVTGTRYYPELRAVMVHDPSNRLNPSIFEKTARLPLIQVLSKGTRRRGFRKFDSGNKSLWLSSTLPEPTLKRILSITWTYGNLPEPVRDAHLLAGTRVPKPPLPKG